MEHAMTQSSAEARDQLLTDMKAVIDDAEELLKATAGEAGEKIRAARARAEETLRAAKGRLADVDVVGQAKDAAKAADDYVRENPWGAVGVAAIAGLLVGVLISRR
jgi:ElaB/YqjD/DUF883 family membrane-anchored ribosome-binding protein